MFGAEEAEGVGGVGVAGLAGVAEVTVPRDINIELNPLIPEALQSSSS